MARKQKSYFEPWSAARSKAWESAFRFGPPQICRDDPEQMARYEGDRGRAEANADWLIWGSRMAEPEVCVGLDGVGVLLGDRRILAISRRADRTDGQPDHEALAKRIASCVNACAGIAKPEELVKLVRGLLLDLVRGDTDAHDPRALSALSMMIPPEEQEWNDGRRE